MIAYFDTSGFVPLLLREPGTAVAERVWDGATVVVSSRLLVVETAAAIGVARRTGRVTEAGEQSLGEIRSVLLGEMVFVEAHAAVVDRAAGLAEQHALRGYDAMHLASALMINADQVVFVSGDRKLVQAASRQGLRTVDSSEAIAPGL